VSLRNLGSVTGTNDVRGEIREFLTTRRAKISPEQAGLPHYGGVRWAAHDVKYYRSGVQPFPRYPPISKETPVEIQPKQPTAKGPAEWFTGDVWIDGIARGEEPSRVRVSAVRFTPSARTAWHSHAVGQTLYVTEGRGLQQSRGGDIAEIRPGDIVYTPADEWHWHGAAPDHFMTHLSITEAVPGDERPEADWGEHVTDDEYNNR
jgi:quercetin dioxygenase-like cupin family protein